MRKQNPSDPRAVRLDVKEEAPARTQAPTYEAPKATAWVVQQVHRCPYVTCSRRQSSKATKLDELMLF